MSEKIYGYAGKILRVDLSTGDISTESITKYAPKYIGGRGMGARIYWDEIKPEVEALSAENKLIFLSGPLTGTGAMGGGRSSLVTKAGKGYPKKTYWHGTSGNMFGTEMKFAGYDVLIVQGAAEKPVYLWINDGQVEIRSAADQWGMMVETARAEYKRLHGEAVQAAIIGPAGENLVVHSGISTEFGSGFSQGGVGAVMGFKKLKAIVVRGTGRIEIANPKALMQVMREKIDWVSTPVGETRMIDGKPYVGKKLKGCTMYGGKDWPYTAKESEIKVKKRSCCGCAMNCRISVEPLDKSFPTGSSECAGSSFYAQQEKLYYTLDSVNGKVAHKIAGLAENLGLDMMYPFSMSPWFSSRLSASLFKRGIITKENTGLLLDEFGSEKFGEDYLMDLAYRKNWGAIVADGDERAIDYVMSHEEFGPNRAAARRVYEEWYPRKGDFNGVDFHSVFRYMNTCDYNLRFLVAQTDIKRAKDYEPSYHEIPSMELVQKWIGTTKFMEPHYWGPEVAQAAITHEVQALEPDALGLCCYLTGIYPYQQVKGSNFGQQVPSIENAPEHPSSGVEYWNAVMGTNLTQEELNQQYNMCRNVEAAILAREATPGKNRENFEYYDWVYEELTDSEGIPSAPKEDYERTLSQYFKMRGWDENGIPMRETLVAYGLEDIADELKERGVLPE